MLYNTTVVSAWVGNGPKPHRIYGRRDDTQLKEMIDVSAPCRTVNIAAVAYAHLLILDEQIKSRPVDSSAIHVRVVPADGRTARLAIVAG